MTSLALAPRSTLLGKALRLTLRLIPGRAVMTVRSGLNRGFKWIAGSSTHGCWLGTYDHDKQAIVERFVRAGMQVFDIGANAGFYTLAFSRLVGDAGHVWAFEPFAENAVNLLQHLQLNAIRNVTLVQAAVSDRSAVIGFETAQGNSMGKISEAVRNYLLPTVSIDDLLSRQVVMAPDLMKIDVEGAEFHVLSGALKTLEAHKPTLLIELHDQDQTRKCRELLESAGYDLHLLGGENICGTIVSDQIYAVPKHRTP